MTDRITLTKEERHSLGCNCTRLDDVWHHKYDCPVPTVESILSARLQAARAEAAAEFAQRVESLSDEFVRLSDKDTTLLTITEANRMVCELLTKDEWLAHHSRAAEFRRAGQQQKEGQ